VNHSLAALKLRGSKREQIAEFFRVHFGERIGSPFLHQVFGSSFRARVSEINADERSPIVIRNRVLVGDGAEISVYWSELRFGGSATRPPAVSTQPQPGVELSLFGDLNPLPKYPD
jgi:hypothetical protein